ncbi:MAG: hypothetical protein Q8M11_03180 [Sulfuritalea sp.]|nr:hypothetical protein [Sulfuritalea sp.]MDP1984571.1 hypothetical protein [Sulfuritalea sp.]
MADIPQSDPRRLLFDVDESLAGLDATVAEIGPKLALRALARLDQFARPSVVQLLTRYLSVGQREYMADSVWSALDIHAAHQFRGYRTFLNSSIELATDDDKLRTARCAARAMMAWALRKKLQRFRYRTPGADLWQEAHDLLQVLNRLGLLNTRVVPYRNEAESSPLGEYLIGLYLEFVPVGNVVPQQLEFAERFLRATDNLDLSSQPHDLTTYRIDLGAALGPQRLNPGDPVGGSIRYCSVRKLRGAVLRLASLVRKPGEAPEWLAQVPASPEQIEGAVLILMSHWAQAPPTRGNDRVSQTGELRVVLGFGLARRMIAAAQFARLGRSFEYEGEDVTRMFDEDRFGSVAAEDEIAKAAAAAAKAPVAAKTPIEILRRLESGGDQAQMETWTLVDSSATGLGAVVPAVLPRHRIGLLICLREADGMDWRLGLIRRIGRNAANQPSIGIETLGWPSICGLAKPVGEESAWARVADGGGHGWSDAIIVSETGRELILPAGTFVADIEIEFRGESGLWRLRLDSLLDRGPDYDRIEFTRIS